MGVTRKQSTPNFPKSKHFLSPCVSRGKKCSFFGKFGMLCFLVAPVLRFARLPYYRQIYVLNTPLITTKTSDSKLSNASLKFEVKFVRKRYSSKGRTAYNISKDSPATT